MKIIFAILIFITLDSFCQPDTAVVTIASVKNLTGLTLQYSKDTVTWNDVLNLTGVIDTGTYKYPFSVVQGYWRIKSLGRNELSPYVNFYDILPLTLTNWAINYYRLYDLIQWRSQNESNLKKYLISRSLDGVHFTRVMEVTPKGNSDYKIRVNK